jgi:ABC-type Fe3+/spermidine/putrescine transport system ATPase subunit
VGPHRPRSRPRILNPFLAIAGLGKRFGAIPVLADVSLTVARGEVLALLGQSGSGKTTLLRLLAGFESADAGTIRVDGEDVTLVKPARRGFGMVFQHYALFPHLSVGENVAFGLTARGDDKARVAARVAAALQLVQLSGKQAMRVGELSGGMQQRVALARALAPEPRLLLLDEPLSNLDPSLRESTRRELRGAIDSVGITTVLVTHEQEEAFDLGDRVAVLHNGRLAQIGTPAELYSNPVSRFVAGFVGRGSWLRAADGGEMFVRPEALRFADAGEAEAWTGRVVGRRFAGPYSYFAVVLEQGETVEVMAPYGAAAMGDTVAVALNGAGLRLER